MAKKRVSKDKDFFEVCFVGPGLSPDKISLRAVSEALAAVQDLASGRDPYETAQVPHEKAIGLVRVRKGSAIYRCVSRAPQEATRNLSRVGRLLSKGKDDGDLLVAALNPIESLSDVAKSVGCRVEVTSGSDRKPLFAVTEDDFAKISSRLLLTGETSISGTIERVGGATANRCLMRVPGRRRILYCDVKDRNTARKLGQHLWEDIVAQGTAVWIHRTWRIYRFTINSFSQPRLGNATKAIAELREAGLSAWDDIEDPEAYLEELRS